MRADRDHHHAGIADGRALGRIVRPCSGVLRPKIVLVPLRRFRACLGKSKKQERGNADARGSE